MSNSSDPKTIASMEMDEPSVPLDHPSEAAEDQIAVEDMSGRQFRNFRRKQQWDAERLARRANKNRERKRQLSGLQAQLPSSVQPEVRPFLKTTKAMVLLTDTIKQAFSVGFKFTDEDFLPNDKAESLVEALCLQGTHSIDSIRIQAFVTRLFRSIRSHRFGYILNDDVHEMKNQGFYQTVADEIKAKGIVGGGLTPSSHKIDVSPKTCQAMHELFVNGRKAYLRDLVESDEMKEGVYTQKMKELIEAVDYWMRYLDKYQEERQGGVAEDDEMFTVFNDVALS
ncbi:hypothetical protein HER10_EVM0004324 [Colletotrichum scovillei]|uniref:Uncharacterized protein n=1 Tax=Colletotrichum scovillei TaxID=1209932 RepID=A0A9P7RFD5_9PEZI|nr:uncharacterized protein HER10_EVM0004324 [Colletotrichum scovillei]KAF4779479.1 hypothetical protein HER10_EVM0004324 [Colletotrichum scovillei]KAG7057331.1 hypothetical protein JMJ77_0004720 [Colletotrichum scovillei]KAG7075928.1 hypothetical protein JMJ76_0013202 [Colletotrichum scovillei]KAG7083108.1 hypothetical protein JMJ78_0008558 [Colletotrichum scovillei]